MLPPKVQTSNLICVHQIVISRAFCLSMFKYVLSIAYHFSVLAASTAQLQPPRLVVKLKYLLNRLVVLSSAFGLCTIHGIAQYIVIDYYKLYFVKFDIKVCQSAFYNL